MAEAVIDKMTTHYRLAGDSQRRAQIARRLDRVASKLLTEALDDLTQGQASSDNEPVICIRRLRLALWLDADRLDDGAAARHWAEAIMQAIYKRQADGGSDEVMRFPSENVRLAAWVADLLDGMADQRWYWREFEHEMDLSNGRAIAVVLGRNPDRIDAVINLLFARSYANRFVAALGHSDVISVWQSWAGCTPEAGPAATPRLLETIRNVTPPPVETQSRAGRARTALSWLIELTMGASALKVETASRLAVQLGYLSVLMARSARLRAALAAATIEAEDLRSMLFELQTEYEAAANWLIAQIETAEGRSAVRALAALALHGIVPEVDGPVPVQSKAEKLRSSYAGAALLLPSIDALGLAERLGPIGRRDLLAAAIGGKYEPLARMDPVLRRLAGLADHTLPEFCPAPDWPHAEELGLSVGVDSRGEEPGAQQPQIHALRACAHEFAQGLRGMQGSSLGYLSKQFFHQPGTVIIAPHAVTVRLDAPPLGILLRMGGRIGDQGAPSWLADRRLIVELGDG